jgi:hypothetical protein
MYHIGQLILLFLFSSVVVQALHRTDTVVLCPVKTLGMNRYSGSQIAFFVDIGLHSALTGSARRNLAGRFDIAKTLKLNYISELRLQNCFFLETGTSTEPFVSTVCPLRPTH